MKYHIILFSLFIVLNNVSAQEELEYNITPKFGFKGGLNYTTLISSNMADPYEIEQMSKFTLGLFVSIPLSNKIILNLELLYSMKMYKFIVNYEDVLLPV